VKNELKVTDIHLVIMGVDFGYQAEMEKLIKKLNLSAEIKVIKNPPRDDVISAYGESEFLVLPSHWELSPLVPLESFAFKKPVISTKAHGIPYTVQHKVNGLLVEPENPHQLSEAIMELLENKVMREKLGLAGYKFVHKECNSVSMAQNSLSLYQEIIKNNPNK
jgi:glycosyltransferase involved in cell wall biosynthesis